MTANRFETILSAQELAGRLGDPDWAVIDCRFDLANPGWGSENYRQEHVPGAVYAHLDQDLSGPVTTQSGRHPLPEVEQIVDRLSSWGIGRQTQVVVYDTTGGAFAGRLWWQLRFLGHREVAVLDGGFQAWHRAGYPTVPGVETRSPARFIPQPDWTMVAGAAEVERIRQDPRYRLIDARAPERFRGEREPIDAVPGHIPGALNRFHGDNLDPDGRFLPPGQLREQFQALIGGTSPDRVIVYCGSGVTSVHHILAMEIAGLAGARLYAGSWSEWIRDPGRPVA
jgi:thiosulfate/3-mercaptopyruvate sulfurtransferase